MSSMVFTDWMYLGATCSLVFFIIACIAGWDYRRKEE